MNFFEKFKKPELTDEQKVNQETRRLYEKDAKKIAKQEDLTKEEIIELDAYLEKDAREKKYDLLLDEEMVKKLANALLRYNERFVVDIWAAPMVNKENMLEGLINGEKIKILYKYYGKTKYGDDRFNVSGEIDGRELSEPDALNIFNTYRNLAVLQKELRKEFKDEKMGES